MKRDSLVPGFLQGGGELGALMRVHDWSKTTLGAPQSWPANLKSTVGLCLDSAFPIAIYWGPQLLLLYNDAWRPILGEKHPWAMGRPAKEVWPEIWDAIDPVFAKVMQDGVGVFHHDSLLAMHRYGYVEECYFDYTFNPIREADGTVAGIFNVVTETTYRVISERRARVQRDFTAALGGAKTTEQVIELAVQGLKNACRDVPFAAFYRCAGAPQLVGAIGAEEGAAARWPLEDARTAGRAMIVQDVQSRFGAIPSLAWPEPIREALVLALVAPGQTSPDFMLVAGASPRRALDAEYIAFFQSLAAHIGIAFANAEAFEAQRTRAEALAELHRAKTTFFSNVSHEFRTPLTLMLGPVQDLLDSPLVPPDSLELLTLVHRNGRRLLKLVNSLLDFSRIEAGRMQAVYEPVDLAAYTGELASVFRSAVEKAGMRLVVRCEPMPEQAFVDRDMWEKIVLNLVSNAFKYTHEGEIRVLLHADGDQAQLSVEDTGIGIPEDELPKVFHRFHRVEGARGRTQEGSGIGLALVLELVKLHGGSVDVQSVQGRGSRFTVSIPLGKDHLAPERLGAGRSMSSTALGAQVYVEEAMRWLPQATVPAVEFAQDSVDPPRSGQAAARSRILLADDNADMRDYVARLLSMHEVVAVADGAQALAAAKERAPDLVLTDVMMPGLDGFGLLKALREDPATSTVPVIMLSARAGEDASVEGRTAGADDYLVKPFSARELQARVEAQLALRRVRDEALERERLLRAEAETLNAVAEQLVGELDSQMLVQKITDAATTLTGARFGAFFHNLIDDAHVESRQPHAFSGAPSSALEEVAMLGGTPIFTATFRGEGPVRLDDVKQDPRYGNMAPHFAQPQGRSPVVSYMAVPVRTRAGEVLGGLFFGHPQRAVFTERAERLALGVAALAAVAMDNARLYQAARDADQRKDEFLATLAHELRNPLAPLRTGVEILLRLAPEHKALEPVCRMMERQLVHIVRLIDDLLDLSRISRGKINLQKAQLELIKPLNSAIETSRPILESRNHRLSLSIPADSAWVDADATRLTQVFANLLNNAAKFTSPGGHIEVRVERRPREVEVSVKDNGIGVPREMIERIFDMFSQVDDPMQKTQPGLGIGLTLARQLVELHGGSIRAESEGQGRGATFRVVLPVVARVSPSAAAPGESRKPAPSLRVLIADDNVDAAATLQSMLVLDGHDVRTVHTGADALREASAFGPQVVLLDLGMPDMDGFEVCRRMRAGQSSGERMLIAAITGWAQEDHQARAREAGFDRHLVKPAEPAQVQDLLAEFARQQV